VAFWNVDGKTGHDFDDDDLHALASYKIIFLSETRQASHHALAALFPDHDVHIQPAAKLVRGYGVAMLVHKSWSAHTKWRPLPGNDQGHQVAAVVVAAHALGLPSPLAVVGCYMPPYGSPQLNDFSCQDRYNHLLMVCQGFVGEGCFVLLGGDFNARIRDLGHSTSNDSGIHLHTLVHDGNLVLLSGRVEGDLHVTHTYQQTRISPTMTGATSRVDHVLCSPDFVTHIVSSTVRTDIAVSDHFPLDVCFLLPDGHSAASQNSLSSHWRKLKWANKEHDYAHALTGLDRDGKFQHVLDILRGSDDINHALDELIQCIISAAVDSGHSFVAPKPPAPSTTKHQPWFDHECWVARRVLRRYRNTDHPEWHLARTQYKNLLRAKKHAWRLHNIEQLIQEAHTDPKKFWSRLRQQSPLSSAASDVEACIQYFKTLFNKPSLPTSTGAAGSLDDAPDHPLNAPFTQEEINVVLSGLHNGVACGWDGVPAEFYKYAVLRDERGQVQSYILAPYLQVLFQWMFDNASLPELWGEALLTLVFKAGDPSDWGNYRPIAIIQVLSKIFALVLNNRLNNWAEAEGKRRPSQAGFRPGHNTEMNSFVLHHLIHKYKFQKKSLFCCYVDLRKAYDSTVRQSIWDRLYDLGVQGKMLHTVVSFYHRVSFSVKFAAGVTPSFDTNIGVRQGCPLSPFLFGVFIEMFHDLVQSLAPEEGGKLHCELGEILRVALLMFADDIVLISESSAGLQKLLSLLHRFCCEKDMEVNVAKTKVVVYNATFQTSSDRARSFSIGDLLIARASEYKYLGLLAPSNHTIKGVMAAVAQRGNAAKAALYKRFGQLGIASNILLQRNLFDAIVSPNLTFGCVVWGPWLLDADVANKAFASNIERCRLSFYRMLLQVKSSTPSWCVYRELGEYPLFLYVVRQCLQFYHKLLTRFDYAPWAKVALLDSWQMFQTHGGAFQDNWFYKLTKFLHDVGVQHAHVGEHGVWAYDLGVVEQCMRDKCHNVFIVDPPSKVDYYHRLFASPLPPLNAAWNFQPYLNLAWPSHKVAALARFRLRSHYLAIETGTWRNTSMAARVCVRCTMGAVDDEQHYLFDCPAFTEVRQRLPVLFAHEAVTDIASLSAYPRDGPDWAKLIKDCIRFLLAAGCIFRS
jgi:exonuclease III